MSQVQKTMHAKVDFFAGKKFFFFLLFTFYDSFPLLFFWFYKKNIEFAFSPYNCKEKKLVTNIQTLNNSSLGQLKIITIAPIQSVPGIVTFIDCCQ
jgi:hypothetical protein